MQFPISLLSSSSLVYTNHKAIDQLTSLTHVLNFCSTNQHFVRKTRGNPDGDYIKRKNKKVFYLLQLIEDSQDQVGRDPGRLQVLKLQTLHLSPYLLLDCPLKGGGCLHLGFTSALGNTKIMKDIH